MKIYLVGTPNAGKTTLFNALTHAHARVGNWHGVTVGALEREGAFGDGRAVYVDLPGIYTPQGSSMEEKVTARALRDDPHAPVLFVAECASLPRTLPLFYALCRDRRAAIVLTKRRPFERRGGRADIPAMAKSLGVPILDGESLRGGELARAVACLVQAAPVRDAHTLHGYVPAREGETGAERLLMKGGFAFLFFFALLAAAFFLTFAPYAPGDAMKRGVEALFSDLLAGQARRIPSPVARSLIADALLPGLGTVLGFLPQILMLFAFLTLLEESGLLSRLAALTDGAFSRIGLNGRAVFSLVMGFGCTAAAILTTRGLDDRRVQRRTILCLPYISCSAKLPVYLTLSASFFENPFAAVCLLYVLGIAISLLVALLTDNAPRAPFVMELAPLQRPSLQFLAKSLLFQAKQFIIKVATVILAFLLASWLFSSFDASFHLCGVEESMLAGVCRGIGWLFAPAGMNDWRIAYAALSGLIAKENVAGALAMLCGEFPYGAASAFALCVFVLTCSPCASAIAAAAHELGWRRALFYALLQTASALGMCYLSYALWRGGALYALPFALPVLLYCLMRKPHEGISRPRKHHARRVHGQHLRAGFLLPAPPAQGEKRPRQRRARQP